MTSPAPSVLILSLDTPSIPPLSPASSPSLGSPASSSPHYNRSPSPASSSLHLPPISPHYNRSPSPASSSLHLPPPVATRKRKRTTSTPLLPRGGQSLKQPVSKKEELVRDMQHTSTQIKLLLLVYPPSAELWVVIIRLTVKLVNLIIANYA